MKSAVENRNSVFINFPSDTVYPDDKTKAAATKTTLKPILRKCVEIQSQNSVPPPEAEKFYIWGRNCSRTVVRDLSSLILSQAAAFPRRDSFLVAAGGPAGLSHAGHLRLVVSHAGTRRDPPTPSSILGSPIYKPEGGSEIFHALCGFDGFCGRWFSTVIAWISIGSKVPVSTCMKPHVYTSSKARQLAVDAPLTILNC